MVIDGLETMFCLNNWPNLQKMMIIYDSDLYKTYDTSPIALFKQKAMICKQAEISYDVRNPFRVNLRKLIKDK